MKISFLMTLQVRHAVELERERCKADAERELSHKLSALRCDMEKQINILQGELATERDLTESQLKQVNNIKGVSILQCSLFCMLKQLTDKL